MNRHDEDAWLDAFDLDDLDVDELAEVDAAAARVAASLPSQGADPRVTWLVAGLALAAGVLIGAGVVWSMVGPVPDTPAPSPVVASTAAPEATVPVLPAPPLVPGQPAAADTPVALPVDAVPAGPPPGLFRHGDTEVALRGQTAELSRGLLAYVHDTAHSPPVDTIRWTSMPVTARPVGTAFVAAADDDAAVVRVTDGSVLVHHTRGSLLASLRPGDEITVLRAPEHPLGVRLLPTGAFTLDEIAELTEDASLARQAVSLVTRARLAALAPDEGEVVDGATP